MSKKITSYQGMIGKTIKRIDNDGTAVKFTFEDDSFAYMEGDFEMQLSVDSFKGERDPMIKPTIYGDKEKTPTEEEIQGWSHGWDSKTILPYSTRIATAEERKNKIDFLT